MTWPTIEANDPGIRPAGKPDRCFYCGRVVGNIHGPECVIVVKRVRYDVIFLGAVVGSFEREDPHHWSEAECEDHKNNSSWCASNALRDMVWNQSPQAATAQTKCAEQACVCGLIEFRVRAITEPGPQLSKD